MRTLDSSATTARFGVFELDLLAGELRKQGVKVRLQGQPFEVLKRLVETPGELVTREDLRTRLWSADTFVDFDQGLNNSVQRIREALGDSAHSPRFIETIPKRGYRFVGSVASPQAEFAKEQERGDTRSARMRGLHVALVLLLICAVLGSALWVSHLRQNYRRSQVRAIAVLPLENLSGDPAEEFFAEGITDELITEVAHLNPLRVISRTSVMRYKGTRKPLSEVASELGVDAILEGSVIRSDQQVRVTAQLIEARTDTHLWSAEYTRQMRDVISLQREITGDIARQIRVRLLPGQLAQLSIAGPVDPAAYEAYLKGRTYLDRMTQAAGGAATQYFGRAIELDPSFAAAYAFLADSLVLAGGSDSSGKDVPRARAALAKALELDPSLSIAHSRLGIILLEWDWDWRGAGLEITRALELGPNDRQNHYAYARYLQVMRRREEALAESNRALELDPLSPRVIWLKASILSTLGRSDEANQLDHKALGLDPDFQPAQWDLIWNKMRTALTSADYATAEQMVRRLSGQAEADAAAARRGNEDPDTASARLGITLRRRGLGELERASIYSLLGDHEDAVECLERAYAKHLQNFVFSVTGSDFDSLRPDPRYQALMHRMNFPP
jgi:TolB-like protein/DNA-binding winged helix-turn-helix (wHTH) protein/Flp pilus assembly protein TadD